MVWVQSENHGIRPGLVEFYKEKQRRRTGSDKNYAETIRISTAEGELETHFRPHRSNTPNRVEMAICMLSLIRGYQVREAG